MQLQRAVPDQPAIGDLHQRGRRDRDGAADQLQKGRLRAGAATFRRAPQCAALCCCFDDTRVRPLCVRSAFAGCIPARAATHRHPDGMTASAGRICGRAGQQPWV